MIKSIFLLNTLLLSAAFSQKADLDKASISFAAIIVSDIDRSINWYRNTFNFELLNRTENESFGYKQANLKLANNSIELIELNLAIFPKDIKALEKRGSRLAGFFKFGFSVQNFTGWLNHLKKLKVNFHGTVVTDPNTGKKMIILKDPDRNRLQLFEE